MTRNNSSLKYSNILDLNLQIFIKLTETCKARQASQIGWQTRERDAVSMTTGDKRNAHRTLRTPGHYQLGCVPHAAGGGYNMNVQ
jgi:hypothetical protein